MIPSSPATTRETMLAILTIAAAPADMHESIQISVGRSHTLYQVQRLGEERVLITYGSSLIHREDVREILQIVERAVRQADRALHGVVPSAPSERAEHLWWLRQRQQGSD